MMWERELQLMKDRQGFQILDGYRRSPGKPANQLPHDTAESVPCLLKEQAGNGLASALKASEQRLSALLHDRGRIGRELHDSVLQALYAIGLTLEQAPGLRRGVSQGGQHDQAVNQLHMLIQDIRRMILSVESDHVDPFRLISELQVLAGTVEEVSAVRIRVDVDPAAEEILTGEEACELVTIAREALSNCVRHAHATQIVITLRHIGSRVQMRICDDGSGFDAELGPAKGIGFAHMKDRVKKIGGRLNIRSKVGRGTCITVDVYLEPILRTV
jgi:two-component system, NarL family, sensor kinase